MFKNKTILDKLSINFNKIINWFSRRWYPLSHAEIEMINQIFEDYHEIVIDKNIRIGDANYIIDKYVKFKFKYTLSIENIWAYNIYIWYESKYEATIGCSSVQGALMGHGHYTSFIKENNRWVKKEISHWIS